MADFWLDFSVNTVEAFAAFTLMLVMFRFSLRGYVFQVVLSSLIIAQTSYLLRFEFHLDLITPFFMLTWFVLSLWRFLRIHPFYAFIMCVAGYLGYIVVQSGLLFILLIWYPLHALMAFPTVKYIQLGCVVISLIISYWLMKKRVGYSFVPDRMDIHVKLKGINLILLVICIVGSLFISGVAYILLKLNSFAGGFYAICALVIMFIINVLYKKELES